MKILLRDSENKIIENFLLFQFSVSLDSSVCKITKENIVEKIVINII